MSFGKVIPQLYTKFGGDRFFPFWRFWQWEESWCTKHVHTK